MNLNIEIYRSWGLLLEANYYAGPDQTTYRFNAVRYSDFVIHCLNGNFDALKGLPKYEIDEADDTLLGTAIRNYQANENPEKNLSILKNDLSQLRLDIYKRLIEKMYIDKKYENLSPEHKYHAFMISQGIRPTDHPAFAEYSSTVQYLPEYADADFDWQDVIRDDIDEARSMHSGQDLYDVVCKIAADRTGNYKIGSHATFHSFSDVFVYLFHEMIKDKLRIIKCKHCGKYFVPERAYSQYCNEPSPEDTSKSCQEFVRYKKYLNQSHSEAARLHKQIYNNLMNKWKRTSNTEIKKEMEAFLHQSDLRRIQVANELITEDEYIDWLSGIKKARIKIDTSATL